MQVTCPGGQCVPMIPGRHAQFPAAACNACALRARCPKATPGQGRSLSIREDEQFQQKLRTKMKTQRGRASLRKRTAVPVYRRTISHDPNGDGRYIFVKESDPGREIIITTQLYDIPALGQ